MKVHRPFAQYRSVILCTHGMYQTGLCFDPLGKGIYLEILATYQLTLTYTQPGNCPPSPNRTGLFQLHQHIQIPITAVGLRFGTNDLTAFLKEAFVIDLLAYGPPYKHMLRPTDLHIITHTAILRTYSGILQPTPYCMCNAS